MTPSSGFSALATPAFAGFVVARHAHAAECNIKNRAKPGYSGSDAFVIEATGRNTFGTGTSVLTYNVNVRRVARRLFLACR
jgi:hypothetical protein